GWHYDVDYTQASGSGGQSHDETETVGTFRIDASNDWKWVWTDRELDQDHVYTYFFENVQEHSADGAVVANFDGFNPPEVGQLTQGADGRWTCSIINEQMKLETDLILKKVDVANLNKDPLTADDLLKGAKFRLEKYTSFDPEIKDTEWNNEYSVETAGDGNGTFTFENLPVGYYKIIESDCPDGYSRMEEPPIIQIRKVEGESRLEVIQIDSSGNPITDTSDEIIRIVPNQTTDPTTIVVGNEPGIELPHTGGPGTTIFYILGFALVIGCGVILIRRKRAAR
ncbi:MAG: LPXTG cell wall anchor domain-containing protein, partial [Mogibacterium sp.]|nr:LPXTG cell wall anchor domain-containing protein [Mogibacterium sp.]